MRIHSSENRPVGAKNNGTLKRANAAHITGLCVICNWELVTD